MQQRQHFGCQLSINFSKEKWTALWFIRWAACGFFLLLTFFFFPPTFCRSWECQVGTSRRTGSQHQHNPPPVEPLQSPPLSPPVSPPVSVPTHHQRWVAGKLHDPFSEGAPKASALSWPVCLCLVCLCFGWNTGPGCSWVPPLFLTHLSKVVPTPAQTWEEMKAKVERGGPFLELGP